MINTKIYKAIYTLAEELLEADRRSDQAKFDALYAELKAICTDNENTDKDHPEQWASTSAQTPVPGTMSLIWQTFSNDMFNLPLCFSDSYV